MRRLLALLAALAALAAVAPAAAQAHAQVERTAPTRGAVLDAAPGSVRLDFSESVEANFGALRVFDRDGERVDTGAVFHPDGRGASIAIRLKPGLEHGGYTATYRVISADSHPVSGGFVFGVGEAAGTGKTVSELLAGQEAGPATDVAFGVARALQYGAIALALGTFGFVLACWLPALRGLGGGSDRWAAASEAFSRRAELLLGVAAAVGAVSGLLALACQGATAEGSTVWSALDPGVIREVIDTRFGTVWGAGVVLWVVAGAIVVTHAARVPALRPVSLGADGLALPTPRLWVLGAALVPLALLPGLGGHAGVQSPVGVMLPANVLHVLAMSAWVGGIAVLLLALRSATARLDGADRTRLLAGVVLRFSAVATIAVALLLASGIAQAIVEVRTFEHLLDTAMGRAVLIKAVLFTALMGFGYVNRQRVVPALRRAAEGSDGPGAAGVTLRRTLRGEAALLLVVLGVTGALASYPPSTTVAAGPVSIAEPIGPARLEATVDPASIGRNEIHLYLLDARTGAQFDRAKELTVRATPPGEDGSPLTLDPHKAGPGHYTVAGGDFAIAGDWEIAVTARISEFDEYRTTFKVPIK